jgi:hypothetical protein
MSRQKLTPAQRTELVQRRRAGTRIKVLVRDYGVSESYVNRLCPPIHPKLSQAVRALREKRA